MVFSEIGMDKSHAGTGVLLVVLGDYAGNDVGTDIVGKGEPIQLDYRLEKSGNDWKIYDVNVLGVWLVENYRNTFAQEISANGIDGLIAKMAERNKAAAARS